jgi:hypothetical protein
LCEVRVGLLESTAFDTRIRVRLDHRTIPEEQHAAAAPHPARALTHSTSVRTPHPVLPLA